MRKTLIYLSIAICSFSLSSCLDVFENIHFRQDGSGTYSVAISIKEEMREKFHQRLETPDSLDANNRIAVEEENLSNYEEYKNSIDSIIQILEEIDGISNAQAIIELNNFSFGYEFDFNNIHTLNNAFEKIAGNYKVITPENYTIGKKEYAPHANFIEANKNTIIRHQSSELGKILNMNTATGSNKGMMGGLDIAYLLQDLIFTTTFTFDNQIQSVSNDAAVINGNTVTLTCKPFAYKPKDLKTLRLQEAACEQKILITSGK